MILLAGATGKTRAAAATALSTKGIPFRAITRSAEKAAPLKAAGADIIIGDLSDASVLEKALSDIQHALLIAPNSDQQLKPSKSKTNFFCPLKTVKPV